MQNGQPSLFARDDTFFGVCQGLGEDIGINPDLFRVALIPALFFYPLGTLGVYFAAGVAVLIARLAFPAVPRAARLVDASPAAPVEGTEAPAEPEFEMAA